MLGELLAVAGGEGIWECRLEGLRCEGTGHVVGKVSQCGSRGSVELAQRMLGVKRGVSSRCRMRE